MSENTVSPRYGETMITPLKTGGAFWSTGTRNRRRTALGATAIVVLLALISWLVWISPSDSPVRKIVGDVVQPISTAQQLRNEKANLMSELVSSKSTVSNQSAELAAQRKQLEAALGKAEALEKQLSAAKAGQSKAQGQVASYKAQLAALAGGGASTGASSVAGSGTTSAGTTTAGSGTTTAPTGPTGVTTPTLASIKNPTSRYFGLYTSQSPFSFSEFNQDAADIGEQPNVAGYFQGWDKDFRADAVQAAWAKGDLPFITWESQSSTASNNDIDQPTYSLPNIINGNFDAYLKKYADAIVANGQPLAIRLDQEMNATWYPWSEDNGHGTDLNGNSQGDYVKMWQHVWNVFQSQGANNYVAWVWSPNRIDQLTASHKTFSYLQSLYPGDQYVDFVGMSGYERPATTGNTQDTTFANTFSQTLTQLRKLTSKKILLSEIGAAEVGPSGGSVKPGWITSLFDALADPANSDIVGFSWFSLTVTTSSNGQTVTNDWRINSTSASLQAFAAGIQRTDTNYQLRKAAAQ
ncbi:glycosyl hydrolase [Frondihabitans australicus]|uniref:Glycosyl hydrolase family 26 n=1 Tax=Frondihabitans australicus TaxID=386892 RepID=A0A495IDD2_9MICO|nr:glycosyl hydrolase [Frondihabitans australicus]RKR74013.1 glycosyl hydrolase family 26 [Frondihabitans australicus]